MVKSLLLGRESQSSAARSRGIGLILIGASLLSALLFGYFLGATRSGSSWRLGAHQRLPIDFYQSEISFSEIENTKATLQALLLEFLDDLHAHHDAVPGLSKSNTRPINPIYAIDPDGAIGQLKRGIEQFKGTDQELVLTRELLWLLRKDKHTREWLDLYLRVVYEHPTWPVIHACAQQAMAASEALGRETELTDAFDLLRLNPLSVTARSGAKAPFTPEVAGKAFAAAPRNDAGT